MASPTGTALIPTQGSCLPVVWICTLLYFSSIVFFGLRIEEVGFTANLVIISCPVEIPPKIPPDLFDL